ncbi:VOC family protein [Arthrobacter sp. MI7-26]|uniref:VOC family protein n=1 Tax=Arthrobacter sp. MI7-26 TaxID=2993653 RepID=UPI0022495694|nr:VOC family protein [Arthrobacter sp. MI7-26]MCX2748075.1 VOC family protein [Arthrobacter sp. MI7-26]
MNSLDRACFDSLETREGSGEKSGLMQIGFVVEDRERTMRDLSAMLGAGPWFLSPHPYPEPPLTEYRGVPVLLGAKFALSYAGDLMIELIEPQPGSKTVFSDALAANGTSLHHFAFGTTNFDATVATLERDGRAPIFRSTTARGARIAMSESAAWNGALEEHIELTTESVAYYESMRQAARTWNGCDLIAT